MYSRVIVILVLCLLSSIVHAQRVRDEGVPGVLLVKFESNMGKAGFPAMLEVYSVDRAFPSLDTFVSNRRLPASARALQHVYRIRYSADLSPRQAAHLVSSQSGVVYAEPLFRRYPSGSRSARRFSRERERPAVPNDPLFEDAAYMRRMQITEAWDVVKGEDGDVVIAVVDDGPDWQHEDLLANVWTNPGEVAGNGVDDDDNGFVDDIHGWNFSTDTADPTGLEGHGSMVAGVAAAVANNGIGMAGTSWNAQLMSINAVCEDDHEFFCYTNEGVLYAALNGADIINASYGGGDFFQTEADVMQAAEDLGSLVVASAGNEGIEMQVGLDYPSSLPTTLSVCGTEYGSDENVFDYGYSVDICAAGVNVLGTISGGYDRWDGTSFATPLVSGIAALVKTAFPNFTAQQVREQLRATADNIDGVNASLDSGLLGRGRVNAYRAVTEQDAVSVRMIGWEFTDSNSDGRFDAGEQVTMTADFKSYLADVEGLRIEFRGNTPHLVFGAGYSTSTGPIRSGSSFQMTFTFTPTLRIPYRSFVLLSPHMHTLDGIEVSSTDAGRLVIADAQVEEHSTPRFRFDVTSEGNLGHVDFEFSQDIYSIWESGELSAGKFEIYEKDRYIDVVHEAGLIVGMDPVRVSGSVFEQYDDFHYSYQNMDFAPVSPLEFSVSEHGRQRSRVVMKERKERLPHGLEIIQESLVDPQEFYEDVVILRYSLVNPTNSAMAGLHAGLYFDAELGDWARNTVGYDDSEGITYTRIDDEAPAHASHILGLVVLSDGADKHSRSYTEDENFDLLNPEDAWEGMSGGIVYPPHDEDQWSQLVASGPHAIAAMSETVVDFAILYGESLSDLQENARRARQLRDSWGSPTRIADSGEAEIPSSFVLHGNYPNPFTVSTRITFDLPARARVALSVIDMLGRTVAVHSDQNITAGRQRVLEVNAGQLASGVYIYRLDVDMEGQVITRSGVISLVR
ncbi:MAG: S8 family peptidase [Bacteroidetes bacterium]|nr:S8 family peptidase [Bacteroidota bacterium]